MKRLLESMRLWLLVVFTATLIAVPASSVGNATTAKAAVLPSISIVGNHFVDGNGTTIRLLGVSRSGSEYMCTGGGSFVFDGPFDDASIAAMASWHINSVRVPLNEDCWLGINGLPNSMTSTAYQTAIVNYVNLLHNHGLYAILELHWNAPGTTPSTGQQVMVDADHGPTFWTQVANSFKLDSRTLFDLYNEPQGGDWACWRDGCFNGFQTVGMQSLINTVRGTGANNPIILGGVGYAGDVSQWLAFKPTGTGLAASIHTYDFVGNCNALSCASLLTSIAAVVPMVTGELGETDCAHGYIDPYMNWADANGISYLGWAWNTANCNSFPALISDYTGTPTAFGIGFRDHLAAIAGNSPTVTLLAPTSGPAAGGTAVTITGTNLTGATAVQFGGVAAATFSVTNATHVAATSPAGSGMVDVTVTTAGGTTAVTGADQFTYTSPPPPAPTITGVSPTSGPAAGGTPVTITGTNFTGASAVKFGATTATFSVTDATHIAATSSAGSGIVDVTVTTAGGISATGAADQFNYINAPTVTAVAPTSGTTAGGTPVTITGTNFTGATAVKFGATTATFSVTDATHIAATSPAGSGTVDVKVTTPGGTSATASADQFTYVGPPPPAPTVTGISPATGPAAGGTSVTITGTNFSGASAVKFGAASATYTVADATHISATSPAGAGLVDVTVTTAGGISATGAADQFTYISPPTVTSVAPNSGPAAGGTPVTITGTNFTGATAVKFGGATSSYTVTDATHIAATSPAGSGIANVTVTTAGGTSAVSSADQFTFVAPVAPGSVYTAVTPVRLLDTRNGGTLGSGGSMNLTIGGATFGSLTVPANATAVILNVTATNESAAGFFTVYPSGGGLPTASNLNFALRETVPNLVSVGLGVGGQVTIYNGVGSADAVVDLEGFYAPSSGGTAGELVAVVPARITDTRAGSGQTNAGMTLGAGATLDVQVTGVGGIPAGVSAVILNTTATNTSAAGFFTVYPTGVTRPLASNLNWAAGVTVPNRVIVPVGSGGKVSFYNGVGSADLIVDVSGYFTGSTSSGALFRPLTPTRIVDTRTGTGGFYAPLGQGGTIVVTVAGSGGVPTMAAATPPTAVVLNVTVTGATAASDLAVWPDGSSRPNASDLNFAAGQTVPNLVIVKLSASGKIDIANDFGSTHVIVDVVGWYG